MPVTVSKEGAVATIRMEWQERRNALRPENADEIRALLADLDDTEAVILAGGEQSFCSGADLRRVQEIVAAGGEAAIRNTIYRSFQGLAKAIRGFPGVVIAAVDGPALGLGADLALVCDATYVGSTGWIDQGWSRIGAIPGIGGAWLTLRRAGYTAAWEFAMSGRRWSGPELERIGLAISAPGKAEDTAAERARWITSHPGGVARAYKSLFLRATEESYEVHLERCGSYQGRLASDPQHRRQALSVLETGRSEDDPAHVG
ncbi:MAG TPA: enoyl-CoA hydratase/isomerase family protein [Trebonia sp.]|jgi:enoyl-CoA hydratase/carnithine racemase|nr:enoyl-CoA hydratase/isomerase family protein [Trebonia sp.]